MVGRLFEKKRPPAVQPLPASVAASVPRRVAAKPTPILPEPKIAEETAWPTDGELPAALALVERYNRSARPASSDPAARRVDTAFSALASFAAVEGPDDSRFMPESIPDMLAYSVDTPEVQPAEPGLIAAPAPSAPRPAASDLERLIDRYAAANGVPVDLARALVFVQSTNNPNATGAGGEIGLMQLQVSAAREMGFQGEAAELYDAETNLAWGMKYLGKAQALGNGETCETLLRYSAGHFATRMGEATLKFCGKVQTAMAERSKVPAGL